uniref:hypothetical protein n=1 Tax=Sodalis glossinidius TaxID=63612 RepID=UPI001F5B8430|nr:hypothetical protein [Sodalis glossinidius]
MQKNMNNREKLRLILFENRLTQIRAAELIEEFTMQPCSIRSVHSWLNDPTKPSSRACPDWVITALEKALLEKGHQYKTLYRRKTLRGE